MANYSFDIESDYDKSELNNVVDQAKREINNRYDLKGTSASLDWANSDKTALKVVGDSQFHIDSILDIVRKKLALRGQSQKVLDTSSEPISSNLKITQEIKLVKGLDQEKAKKITNLIRDNYPKVKAQVMGEAVRITSPKKDELQQVINLIKTTEFDFPIIFTNYR
jgi:uncharacterized protein YajQ (UPF0234 family)